MKIENCKLAIYNDHMDCIFCKIVAGEIPAQKVWENDRVLVIKDINPKAPIHDLIISKKHIPDLNSAKTEDRELLGEMLLAAVQTAKIEGIAERGYRLIVNVGKEGGQIVPHLHFHLLGGKPLGPEVP